jgi:hypothetical protein
VTLLRDVVSVRRRQVDLSTLGSPRTPRYVLVTEDVPCTLQPLSSEYGETVIGQAERATHVAYLEPADVRAGDLLVERVVHLELAEDVEAGSSVFRVADEAGLVAGLRVELGTGAESELHLVMGCVGDEATVDGPVTAGHVAGEPVYVVSAYEVCGVRDEAGRGHHLRLDLRVRDG